MDPEVNEFNPFKRDSLNSEERLKNLFSYQLYAQGQPINNAENEENSISIYSDYKNSCTVNNLEEDKVCKKNLMVNKSSSLVRNSYISMKRKNGLQKNIKRSKTPRLINQNPSKKNIDIGIHDKKNSNCKNTKTLNLIKEIKDKANFDNKTNIINGKEKKALKQAELNDNVKSQNFQGNMKKEVFKTTKIEPYDALRQAKLIRSKIVTKKYNGSTSSPKPRRTFNSVYSPNTVRNNTGSRKEQMF